MNDAQTALADRFLADSSSKISSHSRRRFFDASLYQLLIILAALSGFAARIAGFAFDSAKVAGIIGAVPSVCTILIQDLHCIPAQNWRNRRFGRNPF